MKSLACPIKFKMKSDLLMKFAAVCGILGWAVLMTGSLSLAEVPREMPKQEIWSQDKRFVDHGDGTITDTKTGLMWMEMDSYQHTGHWINWLESFGYIQKLNEEGYADHYDWQMPTLKELQTLYEPHKTNSKQVGGEMIIHIDPIFAKEGSGIWWSIEPNGHFNAFGIEFNNGSVYSTSKKSKARKAVRGMRVVKPQ